ncbi:hypothetical protein COCNU_scaffold000674G000020 [Cocos nucifera]|nr:hypothetical protein [Cocos nucifera]
MKVGCSSSESSGQVQDSLDDRKVVHSLMWGSLLPHIIDTMVWKEDAERFDESFAAYLEEAQAEAKRFWAEVDHLKAASEIQAVEVEHLWEALQREEEASTGLKVALDLSEDKRKKAKEEIGTEKEHAIEAFMSFIAMEDIKIAFAKEAFLEEFEICMRKVAKNFPEVDLDFLMDEPSEEVDPFNIDAASPTVKPPLKLPNLWLWSSNLFLNLGP